MADLTITAANVVADPDAKIETKRAAVAITPSQSLYLADDGRVGLYDADAAAPANVLYGTSLNGAAIGQPVAVQKGGVVAIGATVVPGTIYLGSDTPGGIRATADANSGDTISVLGVAISTTKILLNIWNTGVVKP